MNLSISKRLEREKDQMPTTEYVRVNNRLVFMNGKDPLSYFDLVKHEYVEWIPVKVITNKER